MNHNAAFWRYAVKVQAWMLAALGAVLIGVAACASNSGEQDEPEVQQTQIQQVQEQSAPTALQSAVESIREEQQQEQQRQAEPYAAEIEQDEPPTFVWSMSTMPESCGHLLEALAYELEPVISSLREAHAAGGETIVILERIASLPAAGYVGMGIEDAEVMVQFIGAQLSAWVSVNGLFASQIEMMVVQRDWARECLVQTPD